MVRLFYFDQKVKLEGLQLDRVIGEILTKAELLHQ